MKGSPAELPPVDITLGRIPDYPIWISPPEPPDILQTIVYPAAFGLLLVGLAIAPLLVWAFRA